MINYDEDTRLKKLLKTIKNSTIDQANKNELIQYVTDIKNQRKNNDFYSIEVLESVILNLLDKDNNYSIYDVVNTTKFLLPLGTKSPNFDEIINMIKIGNIFIDKSLSFLFNDRASYIMFMRIIKELDILDDVHKYKVLTDYATEVRSLCINEDIFRGEILSFAKGLTNELDSLEEYKNKKLLEAKKRCGIYPISEDTLAEIADKYYEILNLSKTFDDLQLNVSKYKDEVNLITSEGINTLSSKSLALVKKLENDIERIKQDLVKRLDNYLIKLQQAMKESSDNVFKQILSETSDTLREFKCQAQEIKTLTNGELVQIIKAKDDFFETLENHPEVKALMNSKDFNELISKMKLDTNIGQSQNIQINSASSIIRNEIIIPKLNVDYKINPAFDESIPFEKRYKIIMDKLNERKNKGEIFHSIVPRVVKAVMEGDWYYLYGPSGVGKSYIVKQVASLIDLPLIVNGKITDKTSVMAYNDPHGRFRPTQTFNAVLNGGILLLDEYDSDNTDTQIVLNEIYTELVNTMNNPLNPSYITFAEDTTIPINANFRMISAGNTDGKGGNRVYSSRKKMDESVLERLTIVYIDYDSSVEQNILQNESWFNIIQTFRCACEAYAQRGLHVKSKKEAPVEGIITTRDTAFISKYIKHNSKTLDELIEEKFIQTKEPAYLNMIANYFIEKYRLPKEFIEPNIADINLGEIDEKTIAMKLVKKCGVNRYE